MFTKHQKNLGEASGRLQDDAAAQVLGFGGWQQLATNDPTREAEK
jgi:hypothetical protein